MNDLEYTSLIIDLFLGFICCLLGLLHYLGVGQYFEKVTGIIGIASGAIGFILTIIYVGYSGYIFDNHPSEYGTYLLYPNGARFEVKDGKLVPPYDEEKYKKNTDLIYAKYKDLGKKRYNYDSDLYTKKKTLIEYSNCKYVNDIDDIPLSIPQYNGNNCKYVWNAEDFPEDKSNKYLFDRWITSIIFSCLIFVCDLALALFGFLLFKDSGSSSHTPV